MDDNKKKSIEQDSQLIAAALNKYTTDEKMMLSYHLKKEPGGCSLNVYDNPVGVAVALIPIVDNYQLRLLGVVRNIPPIGGVAMVSGFLDKKETACQAASRETSEEAGLITNPDLFRIVDEKITPNNQHLIFCLYTEYFSPSLLNLNFKNIETQKLLILKPEDNLCFPLHQEVKNNFFNNKYSAYRKKM